MSQEAVILFYFVPHELYSVDMMSKYDDENAKSNNPSKPYLSISNQRFIQGGFRVGSYSPN